jgi:hypothetical protein
MSKKKSFKSKYLTYQYSVVNKLWKIKFDYNGIHYSGSVCPWISSEGCSNFLTKFANCECRSPMMDKMKGRILYLMSENIMNEVNLSEEEKSVMIFHCIKFMFKCFDRAIEEYGRTIVNYCYEIRKENENCSGDNTLEFFLLTKMCFIIMQSNFECLEDIKKIKQDEW